MPASEQYYKVDGDSDMMKKTLVLVVDRDDDFGVKGNVATPVIGITDCSVAAAALGIADPEDSDINALYAAMNIYMDLKTEKENMVEVALICGDAKVGYRSDAALVDELEEVLNKISPDRIILVGDGAEDEYVYPIISSRVPIDSVKKVYVKQAPGLEGTVYILTRIIEDPEKRKRFLAPIGWLLTLIAFVYLIPAFTDYLSHGTISAATTPLVVFFIGILFILYAYNFNDGIVIWKNKWVSRIKRGSVTVTFSLVAFLFFVSALVVGFYSTNDMYYTNILQPLLWFLSNALWLMVFAILIYQIGDLIDRYISTKTIKLSFIVGSINIVAIGLIMMGSLDVLLSYFDMGIENRLVYAGELAVGISLALLSALVQRHMKKAIDTTEPDGDTDPDAVL